MMSTLRPDPDALLDKIQRDQAKQARGHLKIFFGACAGVGKTYAMLKAAHQQQQQGIDVLAGIVETHGRSETLEMLEGLTQLAPKKIEYRGNILSEFDLESALSRKPQLVLVDELAHTNVPGSRHRKRWQDIEELLNAGINVYTTVNVQHLATLNDVVGKITGIRVWETIPDAFFSRADEITLVDLPPDELLRRLKDGKVYLGAQAERAAENFFRKGNLIALRELALRKTADQVDVQMRDYRAEQSIRHVWQAKERILVCINKDGSAPKLLRGAARLAHSLHTDWIALHIELPASAQELANSAEDLRSTWQLASELGAECVTLAGEDIAGIIVNYARSRNASKLILGRSRRPWWKKLLRGSLSEKLAQVSDDIDVITLAHEPEDMRASKSAKESISADSQTTEFNFYPYLASLAVCLISTVVCAGLIKVFDLANVVMLFLLGVVFVALRFGKGAAVFSSLISVASFDFFFVPPRFSFSVTDSQYLFTFAIMLVVSLIISGLVSNLRFQANLARSRERRADALYTISKALSGALVVEQIIDIANDQLSAYFQAKTAILLPDSQEKVQVCQGELSYLSPVTDLSVAQWVYDNQQLAGAGSNTLPSALACYLPLRAPMRTRGVLAIAPQQERRLFTQDELQLLATFSAQIALAIERVHYVDVARDALVSMEAEQLRNSLLAALSHDLRTPLTAIVGLASTLENKAQISEQKRLELSQAIHEEALRMNGLVLNLLDMAKLQSGKVTLNRQWQPVEEVVGSALRACHYLLQNYQVKLDLPLDLPLLQFDAVLLERVLCNLIENAVKYGKQNISISARADDEHFILRVTDDGPGLPKDINIFEKFTRGDVESAVTGLGLGLAICNNIVQAHGGTISASNLEHAGACIQINLPLGTSPVLEVQAESDTHE